MQLLSERPAPPKPLHFSPDEYHRLGESGVLKNRRVELIDGVIIEMSPVGRNHWVTTNLIAEEFERVFPSGFFVSVQSPIYLPESEPEPDVALFLGSPRDYVDPQNSAVPQIVVEVADTSLDYDRTVKSAVYARAGVEEYWIVDPVSGTVDVRCQPDVSLGVYLSQEIRHRSESIVTRVQPTTPILVDDLLP